MDNVKEEKFVDFTVDQTFLDANPELAADLKIGDIVQVPEIDEAGAVALADAQKTDKSTPEVPVIDVTDAETLNPVVETDVVAPVEAPILLKTHAGKVVVSFDGTHALIESMERIPMTQAEFDALPNV